MAILDCQQINKQRNTLHKGRCACPAAVINNARRTLELLLMVWCSKWHRSLCVVRAVGKYRERNGILKRKR